MQSDDRFDLNGDPELDPPPRPLGGPQARPGWMAPATFSERWADFWDVPRAQIALRIAWISGGVVLVLGIITWNVLFFGIPKLPSADELWTLNRQPAVQFVDVTGKAVAVRGNLYGQVVHGEELPPYVGQAFIAAEDQRFMEHGGVDFQSLSRAAFANLTAGKTVQGGSTLTQQLVKNLLVGSDQNLRRKAQEARLAMAMENELTKAQILDLYLNRVYLGANAYGVQAAAQTYFGKPATELTLAESAFLGALPKAPSRYASNKTGAETVARVNYVLDRMVASGFVTAEAADTARKEKLPFVDPASQEPISGYVLDVAMDEARKVVPDLPPDAVITLTVDGTVQRRAEAALKSALAVKKLGASQGAIVVMDRHGPIRALVGGADYKKSQFNRATQALRQPGSAFKTFVYASAIERGLSPMDVREDAPVTLGNWSPRNYDETYSGPITLARALAKSSNTVAAQVGSEIGAKNIVKLAQRFGITSPLHPNPSLSLGTDAVTVLEMTRAYGVLANDGKLVKPYVVSEIRDQRGAVLYKSAPVEEQQVFNTETTATMTGMLANVVRAGTGAQAQISGWQIAGKTGTSQNWRDAWFVGYSSRLVSGIWIGNDDDRPTGKATGGSAAAALFAKVMTAAHRGLKSEPLRGADTGFEWLGPEPLSETPEELFDLPDPDGSEPLPEIVATVDDGGQPALEAAAPADAVATSAPEPALASVHSAAPQPVPAPPSPTQPPQPAIGNDDVRPVAPLTPAPLPTEPAPQPMPAQPG